MNIILNLEDQKRVARSVLSGLEQHLADKQLGLEVNTRYIPYLGADNVEKPPNTVASEVFQIFRDSFHPECLPAGDERAILLIDLVPELERSDANANYGLRVIGELTGMLSLSVVDLLRNKNILTVVVTRYTDTDTELLRGSWPGEPVDDIIIRTLHRSAMKSIEEVCHLKSDGHTVLIVVRKFVAEVTGNQILNNLAERWLAGKAKPHQMLTSAAAS